MDDSTTSGGITEWAPAYLAAWNAHDGAAVTAFMTDDVFYTDLALGVGMEGRETVAAFVEGLAETFSSDYRFEAVSVQGDGDAYALEWVMSGTNDRADPERGLPATGRRFHAPGVSVGTLRDGRIHRNRDYWDLAGYLVEVGLMPAPEAPAPA